MVELSTDQLAAVDALKVALNETGAAQLNGPAGSGKTTLVASGLAERLGFSRPLNVSMTGKAVDRMRSMGLQAQTIHSALYSPVGDKALEIAQAEAQLRAATDQATRDRLRRQLLDLRTDLMFVAKGQGLAGHDLIVVDEMSMVTEDIGEEIHSQALPVLSIGDLAQLPPVKQRCYYSAGEATYTLSTIHRAAEGSPVIRLSRDIREGAMPTAERGIKSSAVRDADQIICHTNKTRLALTVIARELKGFTGPLPRPGERIIFLSNNRELGVFNGQQATVLEIDESPFERMGFGVVDSVLKFDGGGERRMLLATAAFEAVYHEGADAIQRRLSELDSYRAGAASATFAHVITCHKAQGSEWSKVLVIDDYVGQGKRRWLYTAVTRAKQEVSIVKPVTAYGIKVKKIRASVRPLWTTGNEPAMHRGLKW